MNTLKNLNMKNKIRSGLISIAVIMFVFVIGCVSPNNELPDVQDFNIVPNGWEGYGLYETIVFKISISCDGKKQPKWSVSGLGKIVGSNIGEEIEWNSGHGAGNSTITVEYNGITKSVNVKTTLPEDEVPPTFWSHIVVPEIMGDERSCVCNKTQLEWNKFHRKQLSEVTQLSNKLEGYIRAWLRGEKPARIPEGYLPDTIDNKKTHSWTLQKPEQVNPEDQWYYYPAREEPSLNDFKALHKSNAATHVTYLKLHYIAPIDSQLIIEGDFPHCRFMSLQISTPVDPKFPAFGNEGQMEVPIVDVDIEPDEGHTNPFRVGSNRKVVNRHYHVYFDLKVGSMIELNPVLQNSYFRAPGNTRVGGPFALASVVANGVITVPVLWLRYYVPDNGTGPLAGVPLPKALLKLNTGEEFWIQPDLTFAKQRQLKVLPGTTTPPREPFLCTGPHFGWFKMFGIYQLHAEGRAYINYAEPYGPYPEKVIKKMLRDELKCVESRGADLEPPGNIGHSATDCPYNSYLSRPIQLGDNMVVVITGKMPLTPKTRNGESTMEKAQARYWSICHTGKGPDRMYNGVVYGCLMDEDVIVDSESNYIIVYSRGDERPWNAQQEYGVTWQDFGPESIQGFPIRWMSVYPDHYMEDYVPNDNNIPWQVGAWSQDTYDKSLVGENRPGIMGPYHPVIHYMSKEEFEALGTSIDAKNIPVWTILK